ncbi:MAG: hypothetical protein KDD39_04295 [Bdellovibrionales bacterium]|nr:hypothetical protein [Bdellovibrionales bacterium]
MKTIFLVITWVLASAAIAEEAPTKVDTSRCNVRVAYGSSGTSRCFFDEVMIGIDSVDPLRVRCGRLEVTCPTNPDGAGNKLTMDTEGFEF